MSLLEIEGLTASYGPVRALHGVDLTVGAGQVVALLGPNGAGKTTTLRAVCGMVRTTGTIRFAGRDLAGTAPEKVARLGIGHVPEGRGTFGSLTVAENLRLGAYGRKDAAAVRSDTDEWYSTFPRLAERRDQQAGSLSGGEQQMLAIARALLGRPSLLLLDEPSLGLAPLVVREVFAVLGRVRAERGTGMVLVEQNAALALELADTAYVLEAGRTVLSGPAAEIRTEESVRRAYLGY
ncbi:MAG: Branched-chain amino acid transport ATP-binding protein LivF [uncultured Corynebacteriales bacterium]|uniref:Branched-chain amino acid transport ATP-binding protein LivF n=1 Tax=uncultured Mycobacteriales bacterium TaxID=581187 RepID=A0A6J4IA31_9ACTN|nr:MAG: Branched-chain amino acid transport ATP-binding protein LivF [uncultured Corynebacteriales bacterium]